MQYSNIRSTIKSGDVIAWSEGGWSNWHDIQVSIVRMFTESEYSHIGVAYVVAGRVFVVEAVVPLIRIFPLSKLTPFFYFKAPDTWWSDKMEEELVSKVGLPYSKLEAIKAFMGMNTDGTENWECAKLVNKTLMTADAGFDAVKDVPTDIVKYIMDKYNIPAVYVE
jgi:hypothetical protein